MSENMMCSAHKASNKKYRDKYDEIFKKLPTQTPTARTGGFVKDKKKYIRKHNEDI
jgi:hypothetical protein